MNTENAGPWGRVGILSTRLVEPAIDADGAAASLPPLHYHSQLAVIGGGPAGLRAAEVAATAGLQVTLYDGKPSVGRKFLVAGKGGLNLTHSESLDRFVKVGDVFSVAQILKTNRPAPPPIRTASQRIVIPGASCAASQSIRSFSPAASSTASTCAFFTAMDCSSIASACTVASSVGTWSGRRAARIAR